MAADLKLRDRPRPAGSRSKRGGAKRGAAERRRAEHPGRRLDPGDPRRPPAPEPAGSATRARLLEAAAELSFEAGYEALSASDLIAASGVARSAFYALFDSKRECVAAAHEAALAGLEARVEAARPEAGGWHEGVEATLGALARDLADSPRLAHLVVVVGSALRLEEPELDPAPRLLAALGAPGAPGEAALAPAVAAGARAAVWELLFEEVRAGRAAELRRRLGELAFAALSPFLGAAEAFEEARALVAREARGEEPQRPWKLLDSGVGDRPGDTVERLESLRAAGELRHCDLARALGVSTRTISRWLSGQGKPSEAAERRAAGALEALERLVDARALNGHSAQGANGHRAGPLGSKGPI